MGRALPKIEGWLRPLEDDRLEIFLKVEHAQGIPDTKLRSSGTTTDMHELVDWFEAKTGMTVQVPNRVRTGPAPIAGQVTLDLGGDTSG